MGSTSQNFIWAVGNQKVTSSSPSQSLNQHVQNGFYGLDLTRATGGNSQNPFVTTSGSSGSGSSGNGSSGNGSSGSGGSGNGSSGSGSSGSGSSGSSSSGSSSSGSSSSSKSIAAPFTKADKVLIAHGMILSLASYAVCSWLL